MENLIDIKDQALASHLEYDGYFKTPVLGQEDVNYLLKLYKNEYLPKKQNNNVVTHGLKDLAPNDRKELSDKIIEVFKPYIETYLGNYDIKIGTFFVKRPSNGQNAVIKPHNDITLLKNETSRRKIHLWCSLVPANQSNGALYMLKGSHKFFPPVHSNTISFPYSKIQDVVFENMDVVEMNSGEGIFFDSRTIHCSENNNTEEDRISVTLQMSPPEEEIISLYHNKEKEKFPVEVFSHDQECLFDPNWISSKPERPKVGKKIGSLQFAPFKITKEEFLSLVQNPRMYEPYQDFKFEIVDDRSVFRKIFSFAK